MLDSDREIGRLDRHESYFLRVYSSSHVVIDKFSSFSQQQQHHDSIQTASLSSVAYPYLSMSSITLLACLNKTLLYPYDTTNTLDVIYLISIPTSIQIDSERVINKASSEIIDLTENYEISNNFINNTNTNKTTTNNVINGKVNLTFLKGDGIGFIIADNNAIDNDAHISVSIISTYYTIITPFLTKEENNFQFHLPSLTKRLIATLLTNNNYYSNHNQNNIITNENNRINIKNINIKYNNSLNYNENIISLYSPFK